MDCADYEPRIADWLDGHLAPPEAKAVAQHVDACQGCADLVRDLRALDEALASGVRLRPLRPDFTSRLQARIQTEIPADAATQRADLKRRWQAEYDATLGRMQRRARSFTSLLDAVGLGLLSAGALTAAVLQAPKLVQALPAELQNRLGTPMVAGAVLGTLVVLVATWFVTRRPSRVGSII